jgi:hypothetical protein
MRSRSVAAGLVLALLTMAPLAAAAADTMWLHVRVDGKEDDEKVRVNLPLDLVLEILPLIEVDEFNRGIIQIDDHDLDDLIAIRHIQGALAKAEDGEYLEVEDTRDRVTVSKKGDELFVHVEENFRDGEERHRDHGTVDIRIPLKVVDALFSGEEDELNLLAAVQALKEDGAESMVTINDEDADVLIWIDDKSAQD